MIEKIGVICQDAYSKGFLMGLKRRLRCEAELLDPPGSIGKNKNITRKNAELAWAYFREQGTDLVVRFTDADRSRWQNVRRDDYDAFPEPSRYLMVCGVAVENVEDWLVLDADYMSGVLGVPADELRNPAQRSDKVKKALKRIAISDESSSEVVARVVEEVPSEVFRRWLSEPSLGRFYSDCRAAAAREKCEVPNELHAEQHG